jgi:hypothetical protein
MVVALISLFVALSGTAYAVGTVGSEDIINNSVRSEDIRDNNIRTPDFQGDSVNSGKILNGAVQSADLRGSAVTTGKVLDDTLTGDDVDESSLDGLATRWAVVRADIDGATVVRGTATSASRLQTGNYLVSFEPDIRECAYVATNGDPAAGVGPPGEISVEQASSINATDLFVRHYNSAGTQTDPPDGEGFHIAVIC